MTHKIGFIQVFNSKMIEKWNKTVDITHKNWLNLSIKVSNDWKVAEYSWYYSYKWIELNYQV